MKVKVPFKAIWKYSTTKDVRKCQFKYKKKLLKFTKPARINLTGIKT